MEKIKCQRCGRECESNEIVLSVKNGESIDFFCKKCNALFGHCHTCSNLRRCAFFEDPDPMPQFVMVRQEQKVPGGVQIIQREMPNPERAKKFCQDAGCKCLHTFEDGAKICCRHSPYTTCTNYCEQEYQKFVEDSSMLEPIQN